MAFAAVAVSALWLVAVWPPPSWYRWFWPTETAFMAMRRDDPTALAEHRQRRRDLDEAGRLPRLYRPVSLRQIDPFLPAAVLVGEDHRFYDHGGIDFEAIREAIGYRRADFSWLNRGDRQELLRSLRGAWHRRDRVRGASTITQQLAKNLYLSSSRSPMRKVKEAVTAYRLEWALGKTRILELYLNVAELGPEVWGAEAASQFYFGRSAVNLTREQAAALAGTLPFPLSSNPGLRPGRMRWRQQMILRRLRGEVVPDFAEPPPEFAEPPDSIPVP